MIIIPNTPEKGDNSGLYYYRVTITEDEEEKTYSICTPDKIEYPWSDEDKLKIYVACKAQESGDSCLVYMILIFIIVVVFTIWLT